MGSCNSKSIDTPQYDDQFARRFQNQSKDDKIVREQNQFPDERLLTHNFFEYIDKELHSPQEFENEFVSNFFLPHLNLYSLQSMPKEEFHPHSELQESSLIKQDAPPTIKFPLQNREAQVKSIQSTPFVQLLSKHDPKTGKTILTHLLSSPHVTFDHIYTLITYYPPLVNCPQYSPTPVTVYMGDRQRFDTFPLIIALQKCLPIEIIQLLIRHGAHLICFDYLYRFPIYFFCQHYIYRVDVEIFQNFLLESDKELTSLKLKLQFDHAGTTNNYAQYIMSSLSNPSSSSPATPLSRFDTNYTQYVLSSISNTGSSIPLSRFNSRVTLFPQGLLGFPENCLPYDIQPTNMNELLNTPCISQGKTPEAIASSIITPLISAFISSLTHLSTNELDCSLIVESTFSWHDPLPLTQRRGIMINILRLLLQYVDPITTDAIYDCIDNMMPDLSLITSIDEYNDTKETNGKDKLLKSINAYPPLQRYEYNQVSMNIMGCVLDRIVSQNEHVYGCQVVAMLLAYLSQTRPRSPIHLKISLTYRHMIQYYTSLALPTYHQYPSLISSLVFHPNPIINLFFRTGLMNKSTPIDLLFFTHILYSSLNLHRLLTLLQWIPDTTKQEAIFKLIGEKASQFYKQHSSFGDTEFIDKKLTPRNAWKATCLDPQALTQLLSFPSISTSSIAAGLITSNDISTDSKQHRHFPLAPHLLYELFATKDTAFADSIDPLVISLYSYDQYSKDCITPFIENPINTTLDIHFDKNFSTEPFSWSTYSSFPTLSFFDDLTTPKKSSFFVNQEEYEMAVDYGNENDLNRRQHKFQQLLVAHRFNKPSILSLYDSSILLQYQSSDTLYSPILDQLREKFETISTKQLHNTQTEIEHCQAARTVAEYQTNSTTSIFVRDQNPCDILVSSILLQYYRMWTSWCLYLIQDPFVQNIHHLDILRSAAVKSTIDSRVPIDSFFQQHYPHSYDQFVTKIANIDIFSPASPLTLSEDAFSSLNPLYAPLYSLSPIIKSSIQPFAAANGAPIITLQLLDFISTMSSGVVFSQPAELLSPPTAEQYFLYLSQLLLAQQEFSNSNSNSGLISYLNPISIPQPGKTCLFNSNTPPGLFWWAMYSTTPSYDDIILLCQHCRTDILNNCDQSLLMVAIAKHWPIEFIRLLLRYTININQQDNQGRTALHYLFLTGAYLSMSELIDIFIFDYGAVLNILDATAHTPFTYAIYTQAPNDILIKLINYTLMRTAKQYEMYYQFFEPADINQFSIHQLNPVPVGCASTETSDVFFHQTGLEFRTHYASLSLSEFHATMNSFTPQQQQTMIQGTHLGSTQSLISLGSEQQIQYLNCPMNINWLSHTLYSNDKCMPLILVSNEVVSLPSTKENPNLPAKVFSPGIVPQNQFSSATIDDIQTSTVFGGPYPTKELLTKGIFLCLHEVMVRCHTDFSVIEHLIRALSFAFSLMGVWGNPIMPNIIIDNKQDNTSVDPQSTSVEPQNAAAEPQNSPVELQSLTHSPQLLHSITVDVKHQNWLFTSTTCLKYMFCTLIRQRDGCARQEELFEDMYTFVGPGSIRSTNSSESRTVYDIDLFIPSTSIDAELKEYNILTQKQSKTAPRKRAFARRSSRAIITPFDFSSMTIDLFLAKVSRSPMFLTALQIQSKNGTDDLLLSWLNFFTNSQSVNDDKFEKVPL